MARPTTKEDLINTSETQLKKLKGVLDALDDSEINGTFDWKQQKIGQEAHWNRDKNIKDVLIHLYEWHMLLIHWIDNNMSGNLVAFLPSPYNWRSYGKMNEEFTKKHQTTTYETAKEMLFTSHEEVMKKINQFSHEELFSKGYYEWTGGTTLGSYCVSTTSSHYAWAIKKINKYKKSLK